MSKKEDIEKIEKLLKEGKSLADISLELDMSISGVYNKILKIERLRKAMEEKILREQEKEKEILEKIHEMRKQGMGLVEIARKIGRSYFYVVSRLNKKYAPKKLRW